jgi:hypothetical protein
LYQDELLAWVFGQDVPSFFSGCVSETGLDSLVPPEYDANVSGVKA